MQLVYIIYISICSDNYCKFIFHLQSFKALLKSYLLMSTAELKILITFLYYVISLASILALSAVGNDGPTELIRYFSCEATGILPGKVCERTFQTPATEIPVNLSLVMLGLFPAVNLVYILNLTKIKQWISRQCTCYSTLRGFSSTI